MKVIPAASIAPIDSAVSRRVTRARLRGDRLITQRTFGLPQEGFVVLLQEDIHVGSGLLAPRFGAVPLQERPLDGEKIAEFLRFPSGHSNLLRERLGDCHERRLLHYARDSPPSDQLQAQLLTREDHVRVLHRALVLVEQCLPAACDVVACSDLGQRVPSDDFVPAATSSSVLRR